MSGPPCRRARVKPDDPSICRIINRGNIVDEHVHVIQRRYVYRAEGTKQVRERHQWKAIEVDGSLVIGSAGEINGGATIIGLADPRKKRQRPKRIRFAKRGKP